MIFVRSSISWSPQFLAVKFTLPRMLVATTLFAISFNFFALALPIQNEAYRLMPFAVRISGLALILRCTAWVIITSAVGYLLGGFRGFLKFGLAGVLVSPLIALAYVFFHDVSQNVYR